jgi:hypothetical protein
LNRITNYSPSTYLANLYNTYQEWLTDPKEEPSPIETAMKVFDELQKSSGSFLNAVLTDFGLEQTYWDAAAIDRRVNGMIKCLLDMEIAHVEGTLELMYWLKHLQFQSAAMITCIDG